jgi:disulfide bond formation protein DsbB
MSKRPLVYSLVCLAVLGLLIVPVGTAVIALGFGAGDSPCVMCWEERIGMVLIALMGLFVIRFGPRPQYVGMSVLVAAWGIFMSLRHTAMHAARDVGQGFSIEILGAHTYTWAILIYWACVVMMGVLLMLTRQEDWTVGIRAPRGLEKLAMGVFLVVVAANAVQAFASTGPPPFVGQGDPIRFSFNPRHWVWSLEEWKPSPVSLRGRWGIAKPDLATPNPDPATGPFSGLTELALVEEKRLVLPLKGGLPTGLAYDATTDRFAISTEQGLHIVDAAFAGLTRHTVVDTGFSVDLGRFSDVAFVDPHTVVVIGENKSYVTLRENDRADTLKNYRFFLESADRFDEVSRSRLSTVRARMAYTMSLAFDPDRKSLFTLSVPNGTFRRLVVSRFDRVDMTLSEEFLPTLSEASGLALRGKTRSLDELYVTAATVRSGVLFALSAAHRTLLAIDLDTHRVVSAFTVPAIRRPVGLAFKNDRLYVLCQDSRLVVVSAPDQSAAGEDR